MRVAAELLLRRRYRIRNLLFLRHVVSSFPRDPSGSRGTTGCRWVSEDQLLLRGLEIVVVPQLPAGGDLLHLLHPARRSEAVHLQLALEPLPFEVGHLRGYRVHAEACDLAADVDRAVVHGVAEILAGIPQDHHAPALHHEAAEGAGAATDDDRAALHVDTDPRADIPLADEISAAHGRTEGRARVLLDHHGSRHHVLGARPADAALDVNVRPVDEAAAEVTEASVDRQVEAIENADRQGVLGARVLHDDAAEALAHQLADFQVDLAGRHVGGIELRALLEVDLEGLWRGEALLLLGAEEPLLRATR